MIPGVASAVATLATEAAVTDTAGFPKLISAKDATAVATYATAAIVAVKAWIAYKGWSSALAGCCLLKQLAVKNVELVALYPVCGRILTSLRPLSDGSLRIFVCFSNFCIFVCLSNFRIFVCFLNFSLNWEDKS